MGVFASYGGRIPETREGCLNILVFGAHPDDCDLRFGGCAMKYRALGHRVRFVSLTNGDTGHHSMGGGPLARRRYREAQRAAQVADIEYEVLDVHNGELEPSVMMRKAVIRIMREVRADLVLCHRPNDYHPDHRAVGILVQDAAYIVTVPNVAPLTPPLERSPVVGYAYDTFKLPTPFVPTVAIDTDDVFERKIDMAHCHESQMYEWLPYNGGTLDQVPEREAERRAWLAERLHQRFGALANGVRATLATFYGEERAAQIKTAESVGLSEYGRQPSEEELHQLFPFLPFPPSEGRGAGG
jgi:LmbE family N-acetylglucosaminyl deacetylase